MMKKFRKSLSGCLATVMLMGLFTVGAAAQEPITFSRVNQYTPGQFTDVQESAWYASRVKDCYEMGLMSGNSATTFNPAGMFTLAEASVVAARLHIAYYNTDGIKSASGPWYQGMVNYCIEHGIYNEGDFEDYTANATRAQMAGIMVNAVPEWALPAKGDITKLPDVAPGTPYWEEIFTLYNAGALSGSDEYGTFQPYAYITRAEVATIINAVAQPEIRKPASLTPLSQRQAPELPSENFGTMSQGLLAFKDPNTGLWGYMKGNGAVVIPAAYSGVEPFEDGKAIVRLNTGNGRVHYSYGVIDLTGAEVIPVKYDAITYCGDGIYSCKNTGYYHDLVLTKEKKVLEHISYFDMPVSLGNDLFAIRDPENTGWGVIDRTGKQIVPFTGGYDFASYFTNMGNFILCRDYHDGNYYDIYTLTGEKVYTGALSVRWVQNKEWFAVKEGSKWGLWSAEGQVVEAIYDNAVVYDNSDLAVLEYAGMQALAGPNGMIFELGEYTYAGVFGDYAIIQDEELHVGLASLTGVIIEKAENLEGYTYALDPNVEVKWFSDDVVMVHLNNKDKGGYFAKTIFNLDTGKAAFVSVKTWTWGIGHESVGTYLWDGTPVSVVYDDTTYVNELNTKEQLYMFEGLDGKYGLVSLNKSSSQDARAVLSAKYDTTEELWEAWNAVVEQENAKKEFKAGYYIGTENGKPVVCYGDAETLTTTMPIQYYKNKIYYDQIKEVGEGYYACCFNGTWYLVHV